MIDIGERINMAKKRKGKNANIFQPETGENKMPSPALQSPANAAAMASGFAGLGSVGSINEEIMEILFPQTQTDDFENFLNDLRLQIWNYKDAD